MLKTQHVLVGARKLATVIKITKGESLITNATVGNHKKETSLCYCPKILPK